MIDLFTRERNARSVMMSDAASGERFDATLLTDWRYESSRLMITPRSVEMSLPLLSFRRSNNLQLLLGGWPGSEASC